MLLAPERGITSSFLILDKHTLHISSVYVEVHVNTCLELSQVKEFHVCSLSTSFSTRQQQPLDNPEVLTSNHYHLMFNINTIYCIGIVCEEFKKIWCLEEFKELKIGGI